MQLATFGGLVFALFNFATSSALPMRDLAPFRQFDKELDDSHGDISPEFILSPSSILPRMDVMDPGDVLPRGGWTFTLTKFIPIVGAVVDTMLQAQTELNHLYYGAIVQLYSYDPAAEFNRPLFFRGDLFSLMIKRESGTQPMTAAMVDNFLAHMIIRLSMGGYRGIYIAFLRQVKGPGMFSVKLQSNAYWESKGIENLPGLIGMAAMGF